MAKIESKKLAAKLKSIDRGAYWFGIIGRISLIWGAFNVVLFVYFSVFGRSVGLDSDSVLSVNGPLSGFLSNSIAPLIYGWLFLLGRDALTAISTLITEMEEIV